MWSGFTWQHEEDFYYKCGKMKRRVFTTNVVSFYTEIEEKGFYYYYCCYTHTLTHTHTH